MEAPEQSEAVEPEVEYENTYTINVREVVNKDGTRRVETRHRVKDSDLPKTLCRAIVELAHLHIMTDLRGLAEGQRNEGAPN